MSEEKRMARCSYYGSRNITKNQRFANVECPVCRELQKAYERGERTQSQVCKCERPSSESLAFFEAKPEEEYDRFYCGCYGWD
jgi:hypothetical protein